MPSELQTGEARVNMGPFGLPGEWITFHHFSGSHPGESPLPSVTMSTGSGGEEPGLGVPLHYSLPAIWPEQVLGLSMLYLLTCKDIDPGSTTYWEKWCKSPESIMMETAQQQISNKEPGSFIFYSHSAAVVLTYPRHLKVAACTTSVCPSPGAQVTSLPLLRSPWRFH